MRLLLLLLLTPIVISANVTVDGISIGGKRLFDAHDSKVSSEKKAETVIHTASLNGYRYLHINRKRSIKGSLQQALDFYLAFEKRCDSKLKKFRYFTKNNTCTIEQPGMIEYSKLKNISDKTKSNKRIQQFIAGISTLNRFSVGPFKIKRLSHTYQNYLMTTDNKSIHIKAKILSSKEEIIKAMGPNAKIPKDNLLFGETEITIKQIENNRLTVQIEFASKIDHKVIEMRIATPIVYQQALKTSASPFNALETFVTTLE